MFMLHHHNFYTTVTVSYLLLFMQDFYRPQISTFVPTIESTKCKMPFLTEEPRKLLTEGRFYKIPLMTGVNSNEGQLISKSNFVTT